MATYRLISVKGTKSVEGTYSEAVAAAIEMESELQPSFGVSIEDAEGATVAEVRDGAVSEE